MGFSGYISSSKTDNASTLFHSETFLSKYSFDINLGKFISDKNLIGLVFSTSRSHNNDYLELEKELITMGPQYRYYLGRRPDMGLYLQTMILWANYVESSTGSQSIFLINEELKGQGIGVDVGLGYVYVIKDRVVFHIGFDYLLAYFNGEFNDKQLGTSEKITFRRHDYRFSFGFSLLFGKLKDE